MRKLIYILLLFSISLHSQNVYVATTGNDVTGNGTIGNPYATWQTGIDSVLAGDTLFIRGGTYTTTTTTIIDPSGSQGTVHGVSGTSFNNMVHIMNYPGETPVLDCSQHCDGFTGYNGGLDIYKAQYIHVKGLEIKNVFMCDSNKVSAGLSLAETANMIVEQCVIHQIGQRGMWIFSGAWNEGLDLDDNGDPVPPAIFSNDSTYILNNDIYTLCDTFVNNVGNAADGIKGHTYYGNYYEYRGNRVWDFSDNAIDISGQGVRVFDQNWEMPLANYDGIVDVTAGRGGIKTGVVNPNYCLDTTITFITVTRCLSIDGGFLDLDYDPYCTSNGKFYNNTAYTWKTGFTNNNVEGQNETTEWRNNIVYGTTDLTADEVTPSWVSIIDRHDSIYTESNNTWDAKSDGYPWFEAASDITLTSEDFVTTDSATIADLFLAPRQSDGSLPSTFPVRLKPTSDLIDAGTDVGLSFSGTAPDIGAFEYTPGSATIPYSLGGSTPLRLNGKTLIIRQ